MTPVSTNRRAPKGFAIKLDGVVHTAGECCQHFKCDWCDNPTHYQAVLDHLEIATSVLQACESCDYDHFYVPSNGTKLL